MFNTIYLLTRGSPFIGFGEPGATDILVTYIFDVAFEAGHYGIAAAWSVTLFLGLVAFSYIYAKQTASLRAWGDEAGLRLRSCWHQLVAALVSRARITLLVAVFADWLRADETDLLRHLGALLALGLCWVGAISRAVWAPWITSVFALFALFLLVSTLEANVAPVDVWALVVVAPLLVFSTLCISFATTYRWWTGKALSIDQLQEGFARNRAWERPSRALGQHVVLLHAALATLLPIVWILDVAISPGNALGGAIGDAFTTEHLRCC